MSAIANMYWLGIAWATIAVSMFIWFWPYVLMHMGLVKKTWLSSHWIPGVIITAQVILIVMVIAL